MPGKMQGFRAFSFAPDILCYTVRTLVVFPGLVGKGKSYEDWEERTGKSAR